MPDQNEQYALLAHLNRRMAKAMERRVAEARAALEQAGRSRMLHDPMSWVDDRRQLLDRQRDRLGHGLSLSMARDKERFGRLAASLDALSPLKVLGRGYSIAKGPGGLVKSVKDVSPGEELELRVADGSIVCEVK